MKIDMKVKIRFYSKLCTQNKILASKMQYLKQQKTSGFEPLEKVDCIINRLQPHHDAAF